MAWKTRYMMPESIYTINYTKCTKYVANICAYQKKSVPLQPFNEKTATLYCHYPVDDYLVGIGYCRQASPDFVQPADINHCALCLVRAVYVPNRSGRPPQYIIRIAESG